MKIRRRNGNLVITLPLLEEPRPSNSGKSQLVATSSGVRKSKLKVDGHSIHYVANAFYYSSAQRSPASDHAKKPRSKRTTVVAQKKQRIESERWGRME